MPTHDPMPPRPLNGAAARPEDGPQDVPQEPGSVVESEEATDGDDR
ncbi:hypothetical protein ACGFNU_01805 [Spirillospora sp. NPDC048911]